MLAFGIAALVAVPRIVGAAPPVDPPGQGHEVAITSPLTADGKVAVGGSLEVEVGNLPAVQNVLVTNESGSPVPVTVENTPAPEPAYRYNLFCNESDGCTASAIPVPAGETLVLTRVVAALFGSSALRMILCDDALADPCPIDRRLVLQLSAEDPSTQSIDLGPGMQIVGGSIRIQQAAIFDGGADITFYGVLR